MRAKLETIKYNIIILFIIKAISAISIGWSIISILYFHNFLDINFANIGIVLGFESIIILLFSIPLGYISDNISRKLVIIISSIALTFSTLSFLIFQNIYAAFVWAIFSGISYAAADGGFETLFYEELRIVKKTHLYEGINGNATIAFVIFGASSYFIYPVIYALNPLYTIYFSLFFALLMSGFSFILRGDENFNIFKQSKNKISYIFNISKSVKKSINILFGNKILLWIMAFDAFWVLNLFLIEEVLIQPFVKEFYSMTNYGIIFSLSMIGQAFLIHFLIKFNRKFSFLVKNIIIFSIATLLLITMYLFHDFIFIITASLALLLALKNYVAIISSSKMNHLINEHDIRNTTISLMASFSGLVYTFLLIIAGWIMDKYDILNVFYKDILLFTFVGGVIIFALFIITRSKKYNL